MPGVHFWKRKHRLSFCKSCDVRLFYAWLCLLLATLCGSAALAQSALPQNIQDLGKGAVALSGPWQFHLGDSPNYASPSLDDATGHNGWTQISGSKPWGEQGYRSYTGYAWYRKHLRITPAQGAKPDFSIYIGRVSDVYAVYWNGRKVAQYGEFPPHAIVYGAGLGYEPAQIWKIGSAGDGVLAVRVWKAPLTTVDTGLEGGFDVAPYVGNRAYLAAMRGRAKFLWLRAEQYLYYLSAVYLVMAILGLLFWLRDRSQQVLFWLAVYCGGLVLQTIPTASDLHLSFGFSMPMLQVLLSIVDVALWFLLLYLFRLDDHRWLVRLTVFLASCSFTSAVFDAILLWNWGNWIHVREAQVLDALLTAVFTLLEIYPLFLIAMALRKRLDAARWSVAFFAFSIEGLNVTGDALQQGSRFTHWTLAEKLFQPLFTIAGNPFTPVALAATGLLISMIYAVYRYSLETMQRKQTVERELQSAQELQQVLIPESLPALPGYAVTSSYRPAAEVGGDFFQIFPLRDGTSLVVLGDVSGHGLRAAMAVSMIVGALHTLVERSSDPAEILGGLNLRLCNRLPNGFATCMVLRLDGIGNAVIASAGHPAPFLNDREVSLPGSLPLGLVSDAEWETSYVRVAEGDALTLYTDGLLEARSPSGELFGFERLKSLIAEQPDAEHAAQAAQNFGQEDDITVLTITRLGRGVESTTVLTAPAFAEN